MIVRVLGSAALCIYGFLWLAARRQARRAEQALPPVGEFVLVEGVPLHYVRRGSRQPVVLLHGSDGFLDLRRISIVKSSRRLGLCF